MLLSEWLRADAERLPLLVERTGAHSVSILRWASGICFPRPSMVSRVEEATDGEVRIEDHYAALQARQERVKANGVTTRAKRKAA
jgi:hypothetical protein